MKTPKQVFDDMHRLGLTGGQLTLAVAYVIRERNEAFSDGMQAIASSEPIKQNEEQTQSSI